MVKTIKILTWLELAINLRSSILRAIWRQVLVTMIFAFLIAIAYQKGFHINQPILTILMSGFILVFMPFFRIYYLVYLLFFYRFALLFQPVKALEWWTVPVIGIVAFLFLGLRRLF
jgi:predicted membrane chloride channel (bestrophin family)